QSAELAQRQIEERGSRFGMIHGESCTMSYCSYHIGEEKESLPAYEMLQVYRKRTKRPEADYESMQRDMGEAVSFFRGTTRIAGDDLELWVRSLLATNLRIKDGQGFVYSYYSSLWDGKCAEQSRVGLDCSPYDGLIETDRYPVCLPGDGE